MGTAVPVRRTKQRPGESLDLRGRREAIRKKSLPQLEFHPVPVKGEPASHTVIRERRGEID